MNQKVIDRWVRDGNYCIDSELTVLGFDGVENTDWGKYIYDSNMKKIILVITCLLSLSVFGQVNEFKFGFPLRANGGLNVGTDKVQLDSIVRDGTTIKFYTGVTELLPNMAGGSVTSVGMTVPTGLSITGSPITSSGTLGLTFAPGYIPSDASQSNWNTAYNWGDHVLGGYESSLGNPSVNGYILSSTTTGTRSWMAPPSGGSMIYPSGSGIPLIVSRYFLGYYHYW